jgi:hypothetical protein
MLLYRELGLIRPTDSAGEPSFQRRSKVTCSERSFGSPVYKKCIRRSIRHFGLQGEYRGFQGVCQAFFEGGEKTYNNGGWTSTEKGQKSSSSTRGPNSGGEQTACQAGRSRGQTAHHQDGQKPGLCPRKEVAAFSQSPIGAGSGPKTNTPMITRPSASEPHNRPPLHGSRPPASPLHLP